MKEEIWKPIEGYEGLYEISTWGRVKSLARDTITATGTPYKRPERIMKPSCSRGYYVVTLTHDMVQRTVTVHRLVALAFIPNPKGYPMINHKDENKKNNYVENLEWCDARYNVNYGTANARRSYTSTIHLKGEQW